MENLITITIRSTHFYLIDAAGGKLMVDTGWAGALGELKGQLNRYRLEIGQIRYVLITHCHPDHAGLTQEIKQEAGARLVIHERQIPYLEELKKFYARRGGYVPVRVEAGDLVIGRANRQALMEIGIRGEVVETPGHSDDSVSLVLDSGLAITGDLHPPDFVEGEARELTCRSWKRLAEMGVRTVYPAHGDPAEMKSILQRLESCVEH